MPKQPIKSAGQVQIIFSRRQKFALWSFWGLIVFSIASTFYIFADHMDVLGSKWELFFDALFFSFIGSPMIYSLSQLTIVADDEGIEERVFGRTVTYIKWTEVTGYEFDDALLKLKGENKHISLVRYQMGSILDKHDLIALVKKHCPAVSMPTTG